MDTPTVSVDFIDFLVEKRSKMRGDGKTEDEIDQKIKEMIFRGSGVIFNHQLKIWKILENVITISVDFLEASYKNDFRFEDYYQEIYQEDEEVESSK